MSLAEEILGLDDFDYEVVAVPEWEGREVLVRGLNWTESAKAIDAASKWLKRSQEAEKNGNGKNGHALPSVTESMRINLCSLVHCVLDPKTKEPVFEESHVKALFERNPVPLNRLIRVMEKLGKKIQLEEEVEKAKKNSRLKPSSDSDSALLAN